MTHDDAGEKVKFGFRCLYLLRIWARWKHREGSGSQEDNVRHPVERERTHFLSCRRERRPYLTRKCIPVGF